MNIVVGVCGKIGSGKSALAEIFRKNGFSVIDCDIFARNMIDNSDDILGKIRNEFGDSVFSGDNSLDRKKLRQIVFNDRDKLQLLNSITHKNLYHELKKHIEDIKKSGKNILFEAAVMFEAELFRLADIMIWIESDLDIVCERVIERDKEKIGQIRNIYMTQTEYDDIQDCIDYKIINNGTSKEFEQKVTEIIIELKRLEG